MGAVQLDDIESGLNGPFYASLELANHIFNFRCSQLTRRFGFVIERDGRGGHRHSCIFGFASGMGNLNTYFGTIGMAGVYNSRQAGNMLIRPDAQIIICNPAIRIYVGHFYNDQSGSAHSPAYVVVIMPIRSDPVLVRN
ncbi:hypothetical protein D3C75_773270 [compost metagenome]